MATESVISKESTENIISTREALKQLCDQLKITKERMGEVSFTSVILSKDIFAMKDSLVILFNNLKNLKTSLPELKEKMKQIFDSGLIKKFRTSVEDGCKKAGDSINGYKDTIKNAIGKVRDFPNSVKENFGNAKKDIENFVEKAKGGFGKFKESIKNINFTSIKDGIKNLPSTLDKGIMNMGTKLSASASKIGSAAGALLSGGLIIGVVAAVAVITTLVASFKHLMESNEEFKKTVETAWGKIKTAFKPAVEAFNTFKEAIFGASDGEGFSPFVQLILDGVTGIIDVIAKAVGIIANILAEIFGFLTKLWSENGESVIKKIREGWKKLSEFFSEIYKIISEIFSDLFKGFKELWAEHGEGLTKSASELWETILSVIVGVWDFICSIIGTAVDIIKTLWDKYGEDFVNTVMFIWDFILSIINGAIIFISGVIDFIVGLFTLNGEKIEEGLGKMWEGFKVLFSAGLEFIAGIFVSVWEIISGIFSGIGSWFAEIFAGAWEGIKNAFASVGEFFASIWDKITSIFKNVGTTIGNAVSGAFKSVVNGVLGFVEGIINTVIKGINTAIKFINKIVGGGLSTVATVKFTRMAQGGFVEPGQMFLAREAGPELVGTIGSKTAVMNNNQIVDAVSNGVYRAVTAAMGSGGSDRPINITMQVGKTQFGKVAVDSINALSRRDGKVNLVL